MGPKARSSKPHSLLPRLNTFRMHLPRPAGSHTLLASSVHVYKQLSMHLLVLAQVLDFSEFKHHLGLPPGLLKGVGHMRSLRHLNLARCCSLRGSASPPPACSSAQADTASKVASPMQPAAWAQAIPDLPSVATCAALPEVDKAAPSALSFLSTLVGLRSLDVGDWKHAHPSQLAHLSALTALERLCISRCVCMHTWCVCVCVCVCVCSGVYAHIHAVAP